MMGEKSRPKRVQQTRNKQMKEELHLVGRHL
jgi:hypothetical protein